MSKKKRILTLKDQIADFVGDCCSVAPDEVVELEVIYPVFRVWWQAHVSKNYGPPPEGKFLRFMAKLYEPVERDGGVVFPGLIIGDPKGNDYE